MKKIFALALLVCVLALTLVACGNTLSGKYESKSLLGLKTVYVFEDDTVKFSINGAALETTGTYKIEDDKIIITVAGTDTEHSFSKDGDKIKIGDLELTKVDE